MPKYIIRGTVELNFEVIVTAKSESDAEHKGKIRVEDGYGLGNPVSDPEISEVGKLN
jgi:hypothetical protein